MTGTTTTPPATAGATSERGAQVHHGVSIHASREVEMEFHHVAAAAIATEPLDVGDESKLCLVDVIDRAQGAPFCAGICEVFPGAPVDFDYDDDAAVCYMLEGDITLTENGSTQAFKPGDVVYIPQKKGLVVFWSTTTYGRFFYVTYPHWR